MPGLTRRKFARGIFSKRRKIRVALLGFIAAAAGAIGGLAVWGGLVLVPFVNILAIPCFALCSIVLLYSLPSVSYLLLAQTDTPSSVRGIFLPFHPMRNVALLLPIIRYAILVIRLYPRYFGEWIFQRILVLSAMGHRAGLGKQKKRKSTKSARALVKENIPYHPENCGDKRRNLLDVYLPPGFTPPATSISKNRTKAVSSSPYVVPPPPRRTSTRGGSTRRRASVPTSPSPSSGYGGGSPLTPSLSDEDVGETTRDDISEVTEERSLASTVILIMDVGTVGPIRPKKWMLALAGLRLRELGYCVIIPDISCYPEASAREMVGDVRRVLSWAYTHASEYGGDPHDIYLMGHGLGGHIAFLTLTQEAIVRSRDQYLEDKARRRQSQYDFTDDDWSSPSMRKVRGSVTDEDDGAISNGLRRVKIYEQSVAIPKVAGLILLAPVTDVLKQIRHESVNYWEHLAPTRRALGPSQTACMLHSPAHLLFAAKNVLDVNRLPSRVMILHGGQDVITPVTQSLYLREVLVGLGIPHVKFLPYRDLGHVEIMQSFMKGLDTEYTRWLLKDVQHFISLYE